MGRHTIRRGWTEWYPIPTSLPFHPTSLPLSPPLPSPFHPTSLPLSPHFPPPPTPLPSPCQSFSSPWWNFVLVHELKRSQEPKLILKIAYQRPICIFRGQRVKTYFSMFVLMLNPSWISGREENGRRNYFKIKSPLKYGTRPRSNSQPLYLQSNMHLQSDMLSSALRGPLKVLSPEMNVSSGVSKVNIIYNRQKHFFILVTLTTLIFWGLLFWKYFRIFSILILEFVRIFLKKCSCKIYKKNKVCLPIDCLNIEDVFVK